MRGPTASYHLFWEYTYYTGQALNKWRTEQIIWELHRTQSDSTGNQGNAKHQFSTWSAEPGLSWILILRVIDLNLVALFHIINISLSH